MNLIIFLILVVSIIFVIIEFFYSLAMILSLNKYKINIAMKKIDNSCIDKNCLINWTYYPQN